MASTKRPRAITLTAELQTQICAFVRAGGYPHVAAEAAGVPRAVFEDWMHRGATTTTGARKFRHFRAAVLQALAQARLAAEIKAFQDEPLAWLKSGPGKETADNRPGWSSAVKPVINETNQTINLLLAPEMQGVFAALLQVLSPFPEARAAVAQALAGQKQTIKIEAKKNA
jgi:hypothetical protein